MVPPGSDRVSRARRLLGTRRPTGASVRGCHPLRPAFPCRSPGKPFLTAARPRSPRMRGPQPTAQPPPGITRATVWPSSAFARRYSESELISFLRVLRCFSSPGSPPAYAFGRRGMTAGMGSPIRRSSGRRMCAPPGLIAACRVLHRSCLPRHPPCALQGGTAPKNGQ